MTILLVDANKCRVEAVAQRCQTLSPDALIVSADTPRVAWDTAESVRLEVAVFNLECVNMTWAQQFHTTFPKTELMFTIDPAGRTQEEMNAAALPAYKLFAAGFLLLPMDWDNFDHAAERGLTLVSDAFQQACEKCNLRQEWKK